ncbi:type VII secretion integral membrane protein EccD [Streptomyces sp. TRM S81-3]|uniref:Type VII secretion integral membrane protein EccD n=1 Tax=Streptomyces griseicoloratus TaxID=2752516 RepID=A0A926L473_9ACTN|nr:type VII secretion integral membrane protein EccD [Streptomyces griseicoloratus]MBD0422252.1 type VII secretion integral membrane protein EccD [Streptomyces griseicoloratus]
MTASAPAGAAGGPGTGAPAGSGAGLGFCRVTIVAPDSRIDVALPDDVPVADLYPEILRFSQQSPAEGAPVGYHLVRRDGTVLDSARSFTAQRILDGELLTLRPFSESLAPAVFDDVSEAVASAVTRDRTLWDGELTRAAGLVGAGVLPLLIAFVAWSSEVRHDMHSLQGIVAAVSGVLLITFACVRARVYDDRGSAVALGLGGLPNIAVAGSGLVPLAEGQGIGRLQFLLACAAVLVASVVLTLVSPGGDSPFVAFVFCSTVGLLTTFIAMLTQLKPMETAAIGAPLSVCALAFLPGLSMRFARLPIGFELPDDSRGSYTTEESVTPEPVDTERIAAQARRGHELLAGLVGGCALVAVGASIVLSFSGNVWAQLLALATGIALLMRAHLFRYTAQVAATLAGGLASLVFLGLGLAMNPPAEYVRDALQGDSTALDIRSVWLAAAVAAAVALVCAIGLIIPRRGVTPFWGRFTEIAEAFVLLTLIPLALAVFDVYAAARSMAGN